MSAKNTETLPRGWAIATLPDLIGADGLLTDGDWVESKDQDPSGEVRLTQLADVGDGFFRDRSHRFMTLDKAHQMNCTFLNAGDVMVARMPDPLGRACIFPGSPQPSVTVVDVCVLRPGRDDINTRWVMNFINAPDFRTAISALQAGSTRKRISKKNLCTIVLPVPPAQEQQRIVEAIESYFTRLDDAVATLERVERNLKRYRASVLKAAVEGRLVATEAERARQEGRDYEPAAVLLERILEERRRRWEQAELARLQQSGKPPRNDAWKARYKEPAAPDTTNLPELPEGWCWATLDQLTVLITSGSRGWAKYYTETGALFIRAQDIKTDSLQIAKVAHVTPPSGAEGLRTSVQFGDVLVTITGANVTKTAFVTMDLGEAYVSQHVGLCRPVLSDLAPYLHSWIISPSAGRSQLEAVAYGAGKPGLNLDNLKMLMVALPPLAEQARILNEVDWLLSVANASATAVVGAVSRSQRLRQSILKWAFEAKLADQDPDDEPASVLLERIRAERQAAQTHRKPGRQTRGPKKVTRP